MSKLIIYSIITLLFVRCENGFYRNSDSHKLTNRYCEMLDTLILEHYNWHGNEFKNRILPIIEKKSSIEANCKKGTLGYSYDNDSVFDIDIIKWQKHFNCTRNGNNSEE